MSVITSQDVVENLTENCEMDRVEAWELYEEWIDDAYSVSELVIA